MSEGPDDFTLYCDAPHCEAALSMPFGVARDEHGWGQMTLYTNMAGKDYDLCQHHYNAVLGALES